MTEKGKPPRHAVVATLRHAHHRHDRQGMERQGESAMPKLREAVVGN